jgi:hypothetical protein
MGIGKVIILGQIHLLFSAGSPQAFGAPIFFRLSTASHTYADLTFLETSDILGGGMLNALIAVMDFGYAQAERHLQGCQDQASIQELTEAPASDRASKKHP